MIAWGSGSRSPCAPDSRFRAGGSTHRTRREVADGLRGDDDGHRPILPAPGRIRRVCTASGPAARPHLRRISCDSRRCRRLFSVPYVDAIAGRFHWMVEEVRDAIRICIGDDGPQWRLTEVPDLPGLGIVPRSASIRLFRLPQSWFLSHARRSPLRSSLRRR